MTDTRVLGGRYEVGALLGRGGMADVFEGVDSRLGRRVAVKVLRRGLAEDPAFRGRFRQEAQAAARMSHPTIVRVFDAGEDVVTDQDGASHTVPFIVMERVEGRLLKDVITDGPLDPDEAVRIMGQVLTALEYSHRAGVVHRDIKPGNIMVTHTGQVKVMDFGIARAVSDTSATIAQTTAILGTARYFSPEQAKGESVDARTDLYSAGVVLFEMLTGQAPFRADTAVAVAYQHVSETPVAPSTVQDAVSPQLDQVVLQAMAKDRYARFQTAGDFRTDLDRAAAGTLAPREAPTNDVGATLFGAPAGPSSSQQALRQLGVDDDRTVRTQSRPPVPWIWAGVTVVVVILIAVVIWVTSLSNIAPPDISPTVPDVTGSTYSSAAAALEEADLVPLEREEASTSVAEGIVLRTNPDPGENVAAKTQIDVFVSSGPPEVQVPNVMNMDEGTATANLESAGLKVGEVVRQSSPTVPDGVVMQTEPASSQQVDKGSAVKLTLSNGKVALPDVLGQPLVDAQKLLEASDLTVTTRRDPSCGRADGSPVIQQSVPPGDVAQRSTVALTYCTGAVRSTPAPTTPTPAPTQG
ncbi:Stk1 family PASTA domain-containing Ser/Thr kinase [Clavibacter michiganensis]|uniref:non-specific serine/threonine protein kinase n=1 Tax=Clavibacter michiganensis subsp. insidiosus TaxID=33014 RepID=A0A0D5CEQ2_9MICO|nr:Stk1 family PASTA domain-containing Ser/Thr kinase [Clavibacter michiganensis]AJW77775.1 serine/threonine protein kinase [Clavibacter michiganensis subsp. insidiosus]AWF96899.1 serine/threonine protein kinase [Clavibacter michiganensis subsp. insidiosus]AWF99993.1 serine/threonine protein kinase [Clavibacter michiganensis subsp. insidiosus]OQJ58667.1 serine/threonine protein kinase [Clavibacter michiganensis subsp. insidiosus]RII88985.1 Stk1 family PASTA domain-containing Ser/Thr kinase [Cl